MKKLYILLLLSTSVFAFGQSNYLVENFDYPVGDLSNQFPYTNVNPTTGWLSHSGYSNTNMSFSNLVQVVSPGLSFTNYVASGIGNAAGLLGTSEDVNKPLGAVIPATAGNKAYASFIMQATDEVTTSNDGYFFHLGYYSSSNTLSNAFRARTYVAPGSTTGKFKLGITFNSGTIPSGTDLTADLDINTSYLVVVKYEFITGADNDEVTLYVFTDGDDLSSEPATGLGPYTYTGSSLGLDAPNIGAVGLREFASGQRVLVDGIVVRTEWNLVDAGVALSTNEFEKSELSIYPNPVSNGVINIKSQISGDKNIQLYDIMGRRVLNSQLNSDILDVSNLKTGVYLLKLSIADRSITKKIIIN